MITLIIRMREAITETAEVKQLFHKKQIKIILMMRMRELLRPQQ
jgi:hypothetical protein